MGRDEATSFYAPARVGLMWRIFLTTVIYIQAFFYSLFPKLHNTGFITADIRSSHRRYSIKKAGLENFAIWTGKQLSRSFFLIKLQACNFIKKRLQHRCFPVNIAKFPRTPTLKNIYERFQNFFYSEVYL